MEGCDRCLVRKRQQALQESKTKPSKPPSPPWCGRHGGRPEQQFGAATGSLQRWAAALPSSAFILLFFPFFFFFLANAVYKKLATVFLKLCVGLGSVKLENPGH